jgi:mRNA-degrading endonuclease RelE of RelBE toxin-antitoxin system
MRSSRTKDFAKLFIKLPQHIKETAKKNYELWKDNPSHPSLEFKEIIHHQNIWSVRVGIGWRALGIIKPQEEKIVWFWIGSHAQYDNILKKK